MDKVILITGASSGIGEGIARELAGAGITPESDTDTETIALLAQYHLDQGKSPQAAAMATIDMPFSTPMLAGAPVFIVVASHLGFPDPPAAVAAAGGLAAVQLQPQFVQFRLFPAGFLKLFLAIPDLLGDLILLQFHKGIAQDFAGFGNIALFRPDRVVQALAAITEQIVIGAEGDAQITGPGQRLFAFQFFFQIADLFVQMIEAADMVAEARIVTARRRLAFSEVDLYTAGETAPIAHITATYAIPKIKV